MLSRGVDEIHPAIDFTSILFCAFRWVNIIFKKYKKILKVFSNHVRSKSLKSDCHIRFTS